LGQTLAQFSLERYTIIGGITTMVSGSNGNGDGNGDDDDDDDDNDDDDDDDDDDDFKMIIVRTMMFIVTLKAYKSSVVISSASLATPNWRISLDIL
jgi:hypothetical protein